MSVALFRTIRRFLSLDLNFVDTSQPTLDLDFTTQRYTMFSADSTGDFAGIYKIWS